MARKHAKKYSQKQPVQKVVMVPTIYDEKEREVVEATADTPGAHFVAQEDGTVKFFVVKPKVLMPERVKYIALGPTIRRGKPNLGGKDEKK